jgi:hypothetical protein
MGSPLALSKVFHLVMLSSQLGFAGCPVIGSINDPPLSLKHVIESWFSFWTH